MCRMCSHCNCLLDDCVCGGLQSLDTMTLAEYNHRFDMIIQAFNAGYLNREEAIDAIKELEHG